MEVHTVESYLAFRYYQFQLQNYKLHPSAIKISLFRNSLAKNNIKLFALYNLTHKEIEAHADYKPKELFKRIFSTKRKQIQDFQKKYINAIKIFIKACSVKTLELSEFIAIRQHLQFYYKQCNKLFIYDPRIIKIVCEISFLRLFFNTNPVFQAQVINSLKVFVNDSSININLNMLFKLTGDQRFYKPEFVMPGNISIWDYISAQDQNNIKNTSQFDQIIDRKIQELSQQADLRSLQLRKYNLARIMFLLNKMGGTRPEIIKDFSQYKQKLLNPIWYSNRKNRIKARWIHRFCEDAVYYAHFIFNKMNPTILKKDLFLSLSYDILDQSTALLEEELSKSSEQDITNTGSIDFLVIEYIYNKYQNLFLLPREESLTLIEKQQKISEFQEKLEQNIAKIVNIKDKQKKQFSIRLVQGSCAISFRDFIELKDQQSQIPILADQDHIIECSDSVVEVYSETGSDCDISFELEQESNITHPVTSITSHIEIRSSVSTSNSVTPIREIAHSHAAPVCEMAEDETKAIVQVDIFEQPSKQKLNKDIRHCHSNAYHSSAFNEWLQSLDLTNQTDPISRQPVSKSMPRVTDNYDYKTFRTFLNIRRLKETRLLKIISEKWFNLDKLDCLLALEPSLYAPEFLCHIERMNFYKLNLEAIEYINQYFIKHNKLPVEVISLGFVVLDNCDRAVPKPLIESAILPLFSTVSRTVATRTRHVEQLVEGARESAIFTGQTAFIDQAEQDFLSDGDEVGSVCSGPMALCTQ